MIWAGFKTSLFQVEFSTSNFIQTQNKYLEFYTKNLKIFLWFS